MQIQRANGRKQRKRLKNNGPRYWVLAAGAAGAIVAFTVGNSHRMFTAYAHTRDGALEIATMEDEAFSVMEFNIPKGTLREVLEAFQKKTGIEISIGNELILDLESPGIVGTFSAEAALRRLLVGTGVSFSFIGPRKAVLTLQAEAATVDIIDTNTKIVSSSKYTEPLRDTQQTIRVINEEVIRQQ